MEPPVKPDESDCCNSGCNPCILDVYEEQLRKYNLLKNKENSLDKTKKPNCISATSYTLFKLVTKIQHTKDTFLFKFQHVDKSGKNLEADQNGGCTLQYNPGQYFILKFKDFTRPYTPIPAIIIGKGNESDTECFTALIKLYEDGKMSRYLKKLLPGNQTLWRGPYGNFVLENCYNYKYLLFIAQGTGIAPIFAIISKLLEDEQCESFLKLFFCCRTENNILLRQELYNFSSHWNFTYEIFLSQITDDFTKKYNEIVHCTKMQLEHISGYISADKTSKRLQVLICGSVHFIDHVKDIVRKCNMEDNDVYAF